MCEREVEKERREEGGRGRVKVEDKREKEKERQGDKVTERERERERESVREGEREREVSHFATEIRCQIVSMTMHKLAERKKKKSTEQKMSYRMFSSIFGPWKKSSKLIFEKNIKTIYVTPLFEGFVLGTFRTNL